MDHPACIVMTTASTEDEAEALAAAIVEAGLAACVQVQRVRSFYLCSSIFIVPICDWV